MKKWILDKWKDGQTDYSLCVICKKKGFKRTWLKFAGHISGSECFREIKRGHVIYNYFQLSVFIWYLERQDLIVTWEIHEMTSCF